MFHRHSSGSEELATRVRFETIGRNGKPGWQGFDTKLLLSVPDGPDADDAFYGSDPPLGTGASLPQLILTVCIPGAAGRTTKALLNRIRLSTLRLRWIRAILPRSGSEFAFMLVQTSAKLYPTLRGEVTPMQRWESPSTPLLPSYWL